MSEKTLHNSDASGASVNVPDIQFFGNGDTFKLICKASSAKEGWMKSTKAMEIVGLGCVVQVTTQQRNLDGSYAIAEAITFVPEAAIKEETIGGVVSRSLVFWSSVREQLMPSSLPETPAAPLLRQTT